MKRLVLPVAAAVALATTTIVCAGEPPGKAAPDRMDAKPGRGPMRNNLAANAAGGLGGAGWYISYMDKIVKLTDDQKEAITEIFADREEAIKEFQAENAEKIKAANGALMKTFRSKDQDAIIKAQRAYQEALAPMHEIMKKSQADLTDVLTAQQKAALHDYQLMTVVKNMVAPVQLSDEQIQQIRATHKEGDLEGFGGRLYPAIQKVLTPEQKATIAKHRAMSYARASFGPAKLTGDQIKQIEAACDELIKDENYSESRLYAKLSEKVNGLLTEDQKEAMKKVRRPSGRPGGFPGWPAPGASIGSAAEGAEKKK